MVVSEGRGAGRGGGEKVGEEGGRGAEVGLGRRGERGRGRGRGGRCCDCRCRALTESLRRTVADGLIGSLGGLQLRRFVRCFVVYEAPFLALCFRDVRYGTLAELVSGNYGKSALLVTSGCYGKKTGMKINMPRFFPSNHDKITKNEKKIASNK